MDTLRASFTILTTTAACIAKMRIGNNYLAMEEFYGSFQVCNGHKHVLCSRNIFLFRSIYPYVLFCLSWSTWFLYFPILKKTSLQDLDHMLSFIQSLQSFPLSQLEQWDLEIFGDNSVVCDDLKFTFGGTSQPKRYRKTTLFPNGMMSWISQKIDRECLRS